MKHVVRTSCVCLLLLCGADETRAQPPDDFMVAPPGMEANDRELDSFFKLAEGKPIRARELAEKVVAADASSYVGHYVLGEVEQTAEANFPRAVFHLERALSLYEQKHGRAPDDGAPWRWHSRILLSLAFAYGDLERQEQKLALLARYDETYDPDKLAERAWPLMKLRRFKEARTAARDGLKTGDPRQREVALNALCAVEFEAGDNLSSYSACQMAMETARATGDVDPADVMNFAESSRSLFKLDEAERIDREAIDAGVAWYGNPWSELAELYTREGRLAEALSALKELPGYRDKRPPSVRDADRNENRRALSAFYVVLGRADDALRITEKAIVAPDRRGHQSRDPRQDIALTALLDRSARVLAAERARERAVLAPLHQRVWAELQARVREVEAWDSGRRALRALGDDARLVGTFRIGTADSAVMPPWLVGELTGVFGGGVTREAVRRARKHDRRPGVGAYYDAFEGEAAFEQGDDDAALKLLASAKGGLQPAEQLLRARVDALLFRVYTARGDDGAALRHAEAAIAVDPGVFRRLAIALPVRMQSGGGAVADDFADGIGRSPRFDVGASGFLVTVTADRQRGEACLFSPLGSSLGCARAEAKSNDDAHALADKLVRAFHERAFSPPINLSQADVSSLDGSPLQGRADDLDDVLGPALRE